MASPLLQSAARSRFTSQRTSTAIRGMDGFDVGIPAVIKCRRHPTAPAPTDWVYQTLSYADVAPYWQMAEQYAIADHHFEQISSASFSEHLILVSGTNGGMINNPARPIRVGVATTMRIRAEGYPPPNPMRQRQLLRSDQPDVNGVAGTMPCFSWPTFADVMTQHGISWLYYAPAQRATRSRLRLPVVVARRVPSGPLRPGLETTSGRPVDEHHSATSRAGTLSSRSRGSRRIWPSRIIRVPAPTPGRLTSSAIVNAIGQSKFWPSTAIFSLWDDFGGMYDHVPPTEERNPALRVYGARRA